MSQAPIYFQFPDDASAALAHDTLTELGYHAHAVQREGQAAVQLFVDHSELTSALEIAQAHGGNLMETDDASASPATFDTAYDMDAVRIPAHVVNEDWVDGDFTSGAAQADRVDAPQNDDVFDPSRDDYNHFSPGVRL